VYQESQELRLFQNADAFLTIFPQWGLDAEHFNICLGLGQESFVLSQRPQNIIQKSI
jgi:hypothetical protein